MRTGFTLIELLVISALFVLLLAILLPVYTKSREKARQTNCLGNQDQLADALILYAQEHNETLPAILTGAKDDDILASLDVPRRILRCPDSPTSPAYNLAADLLGASLASIDTACQVDSLLTADGVVPAGARECAGLIVRKGDIATTRHAGAGFIASFLDGHVVFITAAEFPLHDAIDLTSAAPASVSLAGAENTMLYQGAQHVFTYDASAGVMAGTPFTSSLTHASSMQYLALQVINLPWSNNTAAAVTILPAITVRTHGRDGAPINPVQFGTPQANDLQGTMYYTFALNPIGRGLAHTVSASTHGNTLALSIN